jgi:electron transfer flavoprotein alpha subunit
VNDGPIGIADAAVIIDVGYAIRNRENYDAVIVPLENQLRAMGVRDLAVGGTRKVVEELKLLGSSQQIGQTGTAVNPRLIISIGVSGAPQHLDYIGDNATIIAINKDPEAPIMTLNKRRARPRIVPLVGDLHVVTPALTTALRNSSR